MKCPECSNTQRRREGMKCTRCGYEHVFDPKTDGIADIKFKGLLKAASANDTQYFTFNQLYARYCRGREGFIQAAFVSLLTSAGKLGVGMLAVGVTVGIIGYGSESAPAIALGVLVAIAGGVAFVVGRHREQVSPARRVAASREKLKGWVEKWKRANRPIPRLLETPSLDRAPAPYREGDIYDYGVEKLLIVQHDLLVDLLVKNDFHADQRALVLSERGYPSYLVSHAARLLKERPDLPVILLHDATPVGVGMRDRLRQSHAFDLGNRKLIDAGIFPADVKKIKALGPTVPEASEFAVPVDLISFGVLAGGLSRLALEPPDADTVLGEPPHRPQPASSSPGGDDATGWVNTDGGDGGHGDHAGDGGDGGHGGDDAGDGGDADFGGDGGDAGDGDFG
jgi:hypothetical protein